MAASKVVSKEAKIVSSEARIVSNRLKINKSKNREANIIWSTAPRPPMDKLATQIEELS